MTTDAFTHVRGPKGNPMALCRCEECDEQTQIVADVDLRSGPRRAKPRVSQCVRKLQSNGWSYVGKTLRCPECTEARRNKSQTNQTNKEEVTVTKGMTVKDLSQLSQIAGAAVSPAEAATSDAPEPTGKQTRLIMMMLEEVYDDVNKRYRGESTDKTVAEELGDGIRAGWVAQLREKFFGPAGGNEAMEALRAEMDEWVKTHDDLMARHDRAMVEAGNVVRGMIEARGKVKELAARLDAICRNVGPKAGR